MKYLILFIVASLTIGCANTVNDEIKSAFDKVDKSLQNTNAIVDGEVKRLYSFIDSNRNTNSLLAAKADTIIYKLTATNKLIDSLKMYLLTTDTTEENLDLAFATFNKTKAGDSLFHSIKSLIEYNIFVAQKPANKTEIENKLKEVLYNPNNKTWYELYFEKTPTVAAATILSKFKNDCVNVSTIALTEIAEKFGMKSEGIGAFKRISNNN